MPFNVARVFCFILLLGGITIKTHAQSPGTSDSLHNNIFITKQYIKDTVRHTVDSLANKVKAIPADLKSNASGQIKSRSQKFLHSFRSLKPDSGRKSILPTYSFNKGLSTKPLFKFNGGYVSYNMNYRANIDTPIVEKNLVQHSSTGSLNVAVANIPLRINYLIRRSNSIYFRDINDVQVEFDAGRYRNMLQNNLRQRLLAQAAQLKDSLLELDYKLKVNEVGLMHDWLNSPDMLQKLIEYKEVLSLPDPPENANIEDSAFNNRIKLLKKEGKVFIDEYYKRQEQWEQLSSKKDSVERAYHAMESNVEKYKDMVLSKLNNYKTTDQLQGAIDKYGVKNVKIPAKYQRLMNVNKFGIGRNQLNYSELTSKNISLTGVNFEYNSWYYVAVAAGTVDYRFRDFVVNKLNKSPQYIYMARVGIGRLEKNYFIVTAYKGKKQLFASSNSGNGLQSISITGFSAEGKMKLAPSTYILGEVAESLSPDFRKTPATTQKFEISDKSNKAFSIKFYSLLPKTNSRIEAMYKYTGANFQSFSSFQTNSTVKAWSIKADQQVFKRKLRVSASIKSNDFSNPYIVQNYKSNTVFKSIQASFRARRLPMITVGYIPITQLTYVDSILTENRFQSLNGSLTHFYKLGERKASSSLVFNKFYNNQSDTSFAYYNATNLYFNQRIEFLLYTMNFSASHSKSPGFELNVLDGGVNVKIGKFGTIGFGVKVSDFDKLINTTGTYGSLQVNIGKLGTITGSYDNGYLPASNHRFIKSNQMNINFIKQLY